eukprot:m51a1_g12761 hypothetical protein (843) ;mRNA; r:982-3510
MSAVIANRAVSDGDEYRTVISTAGDVNGDHVADLLLCHARWSQKSCTIALGSAGTWPAHVDVSSLKATNRSMALSAFDLWELGSSGVGALGDIDGDGLDDVLVAINASQRHLFNSDQRMGFVAVIRGCRQWPCARVDDSNWMSAMDRGQQPLGYTLHGESSAPRVGSSVHSVGDLDGDAIDDFAVGAPGLGRVYLHFQRPRVLPTHSSPVNDHAAVLSSPDVFDQFGWSVSSADLNGDGLADVVIGAPEAANGTGRVFVMFGQQGRWVPGAALDVADLNGTNGFALTGDVDWPGLGFEVRGVGDFNGDGIDDLLISAVRVSMETVSSSRAYVVMGRKQWPASIAVSGLDGSNGFAVDTAIVLASEWVTVGGAGDVNGDRYADVAVGVLYSEELNIFKTHVLFGRFRPWRPVVSVIELNGTIGFTVEGSAPSDEVLRYGVAKVGDVNGDSYGDLLMGASANSIVVFGHGGAWPALLRGDELRSASAYVDCAGLSFVQAAAGDLNGDRVPDVVCLSASSILRQSYAKVFFGVAGSTPRDLAHSWWEGTGVFTLSIGYDALAVQASVSGAGDFNGDRVDDLLIGTPEFNSSSGKVWVWYGSTEPHIGRVVMGESDSLNLTVGKPFSLVVPSDAFSAGGRKLTMSLDWDGQYVYKWFSFDPATSTLSGTPRTDDIGFTFPVFLKAENDRGVSVAQRLFVRVLNSLSIDLGANSPTVIFGGEPGSETVLAPITVTSEGTIVHVEITTYSGAKLFSKESSPEAKETKGEKWIAEGSAAGVSRLLSRLAFSHSGLGQQEFTLTLVATDDLGGKNSAYLAFRRGATDSAMRAEILWQSWPVIAALAVLPC